MMERKLLDINSYDGKFSPIRQMISEDILNLEQPYKFNIDSEDIDIFKDFVYLGSVITLHGDCSQEIKTRSRFGRASIRELGKINKCKEVTLESKAKIIHTLVFPITMYRCKSWTVRKPGRKNIDSFEIQSCAA